MLQGLIQLLQEWYFWLRNTLYETVEPSIEILRNALPDSMVPNFDAVLLYLQAANHWVPLEETFGMFLALWTFRIVFATVKLVMKVIPMIG